jgi:DNA-binding MurR/RpiR family transcriptional regulator
LFQPRTGSDRLASRGDPPSPDTSFDEQFAVRVAEARGDLTANDERIIEHIRGELHSVAFHTSDSLAQASGVSRAAVVRFARKLRFAGFTEFRDAARGAIREDRESPLSRFAHDQLATSALDRKIQQDVANLVATRALAEDTIKSAAPRVAQAERVYVIASRKSYGLAMYFQRVLRGVRSNVHLVDPGFPDELADLTSRDVVVACIFRRYSRHSIALLESARRAGACTIVVTDGRSHDFAQDSDLVLAAVADSSTLYDSMVAPVWVLEALVVETAAVDRDRSRDTLAAAEQFAQAQSLLLG